MDKFKTRRIGTKVLFLARVSYVHLAQAWTAKEGKEPQYCLSCLIPKEDTETLEACRAAIREAFDKGKAKHKWGDTVRMDMPTFRYPLKNADTVIDNSGRLKKDKNPEYAGHFYLDPNSDLKHPVPCINRLKEKIDPESVYSGCYCVLNVSFVAYDRELKGIKPCLEAVVFWGDGDRLDGGGDGLRDFDGIDLAPVSNVADLGL